MRYGSLFSGIGGFDFGLDRAGMECVWQCEIDPYRREVLERHWPGVERYEDVRAVGVRAEPARRSEVEERSLVASAAREPRPELRVREPLRSERAGQARNGSASPQVAEREDGQGRLSAVDLICGGFPCQDLSVAGKRAGLAGARSGLFFEFARIVGEVRPEWVLIENVPGLLSSNGGRDFGVIIDTLGELGYGVAWRILDSRHFGVPQRRRRVFIVGHSRIECAAAVLFEPESLRRDSETRREAGEDVAHALAASPRGTGDGHGNAWNSNYVAAPLGGGASGERGWRGALDHETYVAGAVSSKWQKGTGGPAGDECYNLTLDSPWRRVVFSADVDQDTDECPQCGGDYVECPCPGPTQDGYEYQERSDGLYARPQALAVRTAVVESAAVRRLTPTECERLQAFPDNWTHGSDGKRYAALGDAVTVNVSQWIGERIMTVHEGLR